MTVLPVRLLHVYPVKFTDPGTTRHRVRVQPKTCPVFRVGYPVDTVSRLLALLRNMSENPSNTPPIRRHIALGFQCAQQVIARKCPYTNACFSGTRLAASPRCQHPRECFEKSLMFAYSPGQHHLYGLQQLICSYILALRSLVSIVFQRWAISVLFLPVGDPTAPELVELVYGQRTLF